MNRLAAIAVTVALGALVGCYTVESGKAPRACGENVDEHVIAYNYGWNLFGCIPIVCGNANTDSWCPFTFFKDEVTHDAVLGGLKRHAAERNSRLSEVTCLDDKTVFFDFYYAPLPWIIQYKEVNYSAMTVKGDAK